MSKKTKIISLISGITVFAVVLTIYFINRGNSAVSDSSDGFRKNFVLFIIWIPILTGILAGRANQEDEEEISNDKILKIGILIALGAIGLIILLALLLF